MTNVHDGEDDVPETSSHATTESNVEGGTDEPSESMADDGTSSLADEGELNIMLLLLLFQRFGPLGFPFLFLHYWADHIRFDR